MRVLGLDPGTKQVGWAMLDDRLGVHAIELICSGTITAPKKEKDYLMRLGYLYTQLVYAIGQLPDHVAIEAQFAGRNSKVGIMIGAAKGALASLAFRWEIGVTEYQSQPWKKTLTGRGNASKDLVFGAVLDLFPNAGIDSQDEADSIGIALHHIKEANRDAQEN